MSEDSDDLQIAEDPDLLPVEKQLSLTTTRDSDKFLIHSEIAVITRYLIDHPAFEERDRRIIDGKIVAITGKIPIGLVNLSPKPRQHDRFHGIPSVRPKEDRPREIDDDN